MYGQVWDHVRAGVGTYWAGVGPCWAGVRPSHSRPAFTAVLLPPFLTCCATATIPHLLCYCLHSSPAVLLPPSPIIVLMPPDVPPDVLRCNDKWTWLTKKCGSLRRAWQRQGALLPPPPHCALLPPPLTVCYSQPPSPFFYCPSLPFCYCHHHSTGLCATACATATLVRLCTLVPCCTSPH